MPSKRLESIVPAIHQEYFALYWQHKRQGTEQALDLLPGTLPGMVKCNFSVTIQGQPLPMLDFLLQCLQPVQSPALRKDTIETLGEMGKQVATYSGVLDALLSTLKDEDEGVCFAAAMALKKMGEKAIPALLTALHNADGYYVRYYTTEALVAIGKKAIPALLTALLYEDGDVRSELARALGRTEENLALYPGVLDALLIALQDADGRVRHAVTFALGRMREKAIPKLLIALQDEDYNVRFRAVEALGMIGEKATAYPGVLKALHTSLKDEHETVRYAAAMALGNMGDEAIPILLTTLQDADEDVRYAAAMALGKMGEKAAEYPGVLDALSVALQSKEWRVYSGAASALVTMREKAFPVLLTAIQNEDEEVRSNAATALGEIGEKAVAYPGVLDALLTVRQDKNEDVRHAVVEALGNMGDEAIPILLTALQDADEDVRYAAAIALGKMGEKALKYSDVMDALLTALDDEINYVRSAVVKALGKMGPKAAVYPGILDALLTTFQDAYEGLRSATAEALWQMQKWLGWRRCGEPLRMFLSGGDEKDCTVLRIEALIRSKRPDEFLPQPPEEPEYLGALRARAATGDPTAQALLPQVEAWLHHNTLSNDASAL